MDRHYLSFGAGIQSTAIALLALARDPRLLDVTGGAVPSLYVFADTGDEPAALYPHVEKMRALIEASGAHFEIVKRTLRGKPTPTLGDHIIKSARGGESNMEQLPFFIRREDAPLWEGGPLSGTRGIVPRRCTGKYKIDAIKRAVRKYFGLPTRGGLRKGQEPVTGWLGISADETQRLMGKGAKWLDYLHPLWEMKWHRADCHNYLNRGHAYLDGEPVQAMRSACVYCPFHSVVEWRNVKAVPADWKRALEIDEALEAGRKEHGHIAGLDNPVFLTDQLRRLRDIDLTESDDPQQQLWDNECAGICGV